MAYSLNRRRFLQGTAAVIATAPLATVSAASKKTSLKGRLFKTLKIGMVGLKGSLTDKFKAAKAAGFGAIEMNSPGMDAAETRKAIADSGLPVDGTVCSTHWQVRHSDPLPEVRKKALEHLQTAIRDTAAVGGDTALLVVGHGEDGSEEEVWDRSVENIAKAVPLAEELNVAIAIENVWNKFCYDHFGNHEQTVDKYLRYVDEFDSPMVGMQFDIGNHWKYGSMGDWIRGLGKRVIKLDVKGFHRENDAWAKIGEGDIDFDDVCRALREIKFRGWCAAEVGGGGAERLKEISDNMDRVFDLV
ncbi:MAG: sugar phosphate isomerase/epimerase family protein [Pirellulaceae bacterium]